MICKGCEAHGEYGCRAGFTSIVINGEMGCMDADRALDAFHFNQVVDRTVASTHTNADRIRAMSDEELANWLENRIDCPDGEDCEGRPWPKCEECWLEWLKKEADNGK